MPWSGKFKNGESFTDLTDDELNRFEDEIDPSSVSEIVSTPELPEVPADTPSDISVVGFANPTTLAKAQRYVDSQNADTSVSQGLLPRILEGASRSPLYEPEYAPGYEPGYEALASGVGNALNYAAGEEQEDPSLLGRMWKGASQSALYEHPIETGAGIAAGILTPMSLGALGQMGVTGSAVGAGNLLDQALRDSDTTRTWKERASEAAGSAVGAGLLSGLGYGIASGMKNYAAPYMKAVSDYAAKTKALQGFNTWLRGRAIRKALGNLGTVERNKSAYELIDEVLGGQAPLADKLSSESINRLKDLRTGKDLLDIMREDPHTADVIENLISRKMQLELPEYSVFGSGSATPTTGEVGRYILEHSQEPAKVVPSQYILPDWAARYAQRAFPGTTAAAEMSGVGKIARGLGDYIGPKFLPAVDYLAPAVSKGLGSAGGVTGGIIGSEGVQAIQDLQSRQEMPPVY